MYKEISSFLTILFSERKTKENVDGLPTVGVSWVTKESTVLSSDLDLNGPWSRE